MIPGKIWGLTSLAGLLWTRDISKHDSVLIIFLHTILALSAAVLVGIAGLIPTVGWKFSILCLLPVVFLLVGRSLFDNLRSRYFSKSSALPLSPHLLIAFIVNLSSWVIVSTGFLLLVYGMEEHWPNSPLMVASAFAAGYIGGFISFITPAGLGVREGIITLLLGPTLGSEKAFAAALGFRLVHTAVLWLHIALTLCVLAVDVRTAKKGTHYHL